MDRIKISLAGGKPIHFKDTVPAAFAADAIDGAWVMAAEREFGTLLVQVIQLKDFVLWYSVFDCRQHVQLQVERERMFLKLHIALDEPLKWYFKGLGKVWLPAHHANLFHLPTLDAIGSFDAGVCYRSLDIAISYESLRQLQDDMPLITPLMQAVEDKKPYRLSDKDIPLNQPISETIQHLLSIKFSERIKIPYGDNTARGLIMLMLFEMNPQSAVTYLDMPSLALVRDQLEKDLKHAPDIELLAQQINVSSSKLKRDFKKAYKMGLHTYWQQHRMGQAAGMLKESITRIKDIAVYTGYGNDLSSFSRAFKQYAGMSPAYYRKKYKQA